MLISFNGVGVRGKGVGNTIFLTSWMIATSPYVVSECGISNADQCWLKVTQYLTSQRYPNKSWCFAVLCRWTPEPLEPVPS